MRIFAILFLVFASSSAAGQPDKLVQSCQRAQEPHARIAACSVLLRQGSMNDRHRAAVIAFRGNGHFAAGSVRRALADYEAAARLVPDIALYHFNKGAALSALGRYAEAIQAYTAAIARNPWDAESFNNRAWARLKLGRLRQGLADAQRAIRLKDDLAEAYDTRGHIHMALRQRDRAIADFQNAIRLAPSMRSAIDGLRQVSPAAR